MNISQTKNHHHIAKLNKSVHNLHVHLYPDFFKPYNYKVMSEFFHQAMANPNSIFLLIEVEAKPIGYAWIELIEYHEDLFRYGYSSLFIHQLSIEESSKNKGYGTCLMNEIISIGEQNDVKRIELDFWAENLGAEQFYLKHGFKKIRQMSYKDLN